jgi:hypothetical protein
MYLNRDMDGGPFLVYFFPILGGQKAAVLDSVEGWCAAGNLGASRVSTGRMDRWTTGWMTNEWMKIYICSVWTDDRMDDRTDSGEASFLISTSFTIYDTSKTCEECSTFHLFIGPHFSSPQTPPPPPKSEPAPTSTPSTGWPL